MLQVLVRGCFVLGEAICLKCNLVIVLVLGSCGTAHSGLRGLAIVLTSLDLPSSPVRRVRLFSRRVRPDMLSTCQAGKLCLVVPFVG